MAAAAARCAALLAAPCPRPTAAGATGAATASQGSAADGAETAVPPATVPVAQLGEWLDADVARRLAGDAVPLAEGLPGPLNVRRRHRH